MKPSVSAIFFIIFAVCMIAVVMHLFPVGDPHMPSYADFVPRQTAVWEIPRKADSAALRYNRRSALDVGVSSVVCATILDYRAYDTLYETTVLFTAALAVLSILGKDDGEDEKDA
jgi:hypothetical protein